MVVNDSNLSQKIPKILFCKSCDYGCSSKKDFNKHLLTRKHQNGSKMVVNDSTLSQKIPSDKYPPKQQPSKQYICECGKTYKWDSGYYRHQKKCYISQANNIVIDSNLVTTQPPKDTTILHELKTVKDENKELHSVIKDIQKNMDDKNNQHDFKEIIVMMMKENKEFQKSFLDIIPHVKGNVNNNSHNTTNNQFNIQMFLNEHCKDAMNLTDFIQSLPITAETYDHTIEDGLTKSITKMMVNGLNQLDILQRPIHCTDASRKTLYVKDDDTWEKDNELLHLLKGIQDLSVKQRVNIHKWQDANDGWDVKDDLQTKITMLVFHTMTDIENDEKETRKIISAISKNTYLTNEIKNVYK